MAYTVAQLIANAFYTSGIVSRQFQSVDGYQVEDGLNLLNEVITDKTIERDMLPTYTVQYNFNAVIGQEKYFIPNLTKVDTLVFFLNSIRFAMRENFRDQYFGDSRANDINSLPFNWNQERTFGGTNLFLYFFPDQAYPMQLTGLFSLSQVALQDDLSLVFDMFYINYLKYRLTDKICMYFNYVIPPAVKQELLRYEQMISQRSAPLDLHMTKITTLGTFRGDMYGQANLGHGWTV